MIGDLLEFARIQRLHAQSSDRVKVHQVLELRDVVARIFAEEPFYAERMRAAGNRPGDLRTVKDLLGFPATSGAALAEHLAAAARTGGATGISAAGAGAPARRVSIDASGRVLAVPDGLDARARRLHLFAVLRAWGIGSHSRVAITSWEDFGQGVAKGPFFAVRDARPFEGSVPAFDRRPPRAGEPAIVDPGQAGTSSASRLILRGATLPDPMLAAIRIAGGSEPHVILGNALFGPIAWRCSAGAMHPVAGRAVLEAVTGEGVARGLTGGSRASRAPRTAGELHLTLLERSAFPIFRVALGLRGRFVAGCSCGAGTDRIEMELPFLGPLAVRGGRFLDPLPFVRAAASLPGARRVALLQEAENQLRVLIAVRDDAGTPREAAPDAKHVVQSFHWDAQDAGARGSAPGAGPSKEIGSPNAVDPTKTALRNQEAIHAAVAEALRPIESVGPLAVIPEVGEESALPFPERGFIRGLDVGPLLNVGEPY